MSPKPTRSTRAVASSPLVTINRSITDPSGNLGDSLYLTVKMPSNKLREITGGSARGSSSARRTVNVFTENPIITGPRSSRPKKKLVEVSTSEGDDLDDQEEDEVDEDAPGEEDDDVDADGDLDMDDAPPQPPVSRRHAKSSAPFTAAGKAVKSVEEKEMELDDDEDEDDDELSELDTDAEGEPDDQDESGLGNEQAGEEELDDEEEDEEADSDDGTPGGDLSRLTKRQRGNLGNDFLQLPMEPQVKKHLTAEERAMRRAEMARRRKNLSEKRNEEEKMDTINRLLRKQAPKRRGRIPVAEAEAVAAEQEAQEYEKPQPTMVRWISGREGSRIGVPEEWLGTPAGRVFGGATNESAKLVQEV
ncbi:PAPA-1-like domain-containing protein [Aspergillus clavatus NRRL 1]|uniref:INO80 complex subunit B-like conserved region domain-containing protein n=1 Tax=Aspergillus clavatus (strain ATCC 1007 / CBS 513.65 / DSM 816 / NCTC 3887 / NRRL 1 / QM 1276 / 107) TaxID=344612 RepID=A1C6X3_ASPCL|nr:uncharacterized protein ACLA_071770 [Aspergillus clavatus NRRL 1]EAW14144.1 conserved hypothetical protein [Aspergillus clavatus NRRL 1]